MDTVKKILNDIKTLKIQGATNVAKASLEVLNLVSKKSKAKTFDSYFKELESVRDKILKTRPTEPMAYNIIGLIIKDLKEYPNLEKAKKDLPRLIKYYVNRIKESKEEIGRIGSGLIRNGYTILTHCHSSTVMSIFKSARESGKKFKVICTETRPLYQGRITAKELLKYKIDTTMIVDSAVSNVMKDVDVAFIGSDLITATGDIVNKVGSMNVALACKRTDTPLYVAASILKLDTSTLFGRTPVIEQRDPREVWPNPPRGLKILNPAFEIVPSDLIKAIITEKGIIRPDSVYDAFRTP